MNVGDKVLFNYPNELTFFPDHTKHNGRTAIIIKKVPDNESDYEMYVIETPDGWRGEVFADELT